MDLTKDILDRHILLNTKMVEKIPLLTMDDYVKLAWERELGANGNRLGEIKQRFDQGEMEVTYKDMAVMTMHADLTQRFFKLLKESGLLPEEDKTPL